MSEAFDAVSEMPPKQRGWPRAAALFGVTVAILTMQPWVLIGVPFLALSLTQGVRSLGVGVASVMAVWGVMGGGAGTGSWEGIWYVERGWSLLAAGVFAALTLHRPQTPFSNRALKSVAIAAGVAAVVLGTRAGGWATVDWAIQNQVMASVDLGIEALQLLRGGEALPPALVTAWYQTAEVRGQLFPSLLALESMAALGVAWWAYVRLSKGDDQAVGPLRDYRFNDHLVWIFIAGLLLVVGRWGDSLGRVGANAVVFMGALYAARGLAVVMFLSGGLSLIGYVLLGFGLVFVPPLVLAGAMVVGIGDTWLDIRGRVQSLAA